MINTLSKRQIADSAIIEEDELYSIGLAGSSFNASPLTIDSITGTTKTIQFNASVDLQEPRIAVADIIKVLSGDAVGNYTIASIDWDNNKVVVNETIVDSTSTTGEFYYRAGARMVGFDNSTNGFVANETQGAIEEINNKVLTSASPGFSFGRSGKIPSGTWLLNETVPSNISGRYVYINDAVVERIFVSNQDVTTFDISAYYHEGDEVNLTLLGTKTVTTSRGGSFDVSWAVPFGKQIALRITAGAPKNAVAGLELSGTGA